jgi:hypothetical protein
MLALVLKTHTVVQSSLRVSALPTDYVVVTEFSGIINLRLVAYVIIVCV